MPSAGDKIVALWREAGEWWACEPQREICRFIDLRGIRKEEDRALPSLGPIVLGFENAQPFTEDKVAKACGYLVDPQYPLLQKRRNSYAALHVMSGYSFGRGSTIGADIPGYAGVNGIEAVLMADSFSLVGALEFWKAADAVGVKPLIGATFELAEGGEVVLVARNRAGWRSLCRLITDCYLEEPRLFPLCTWQRLERHTEGLLCLTGGDNGIVNRTLAKGDGDGGRMMLLHLAELYGRDCLFIQIERSYLPWERLVNEQLLAIAEDLQVMPVAGGAVTHMRPEHFPVQDTLACIESLCLIDEIVGRKPRRDPSQPQCRATPLRALNAERYLRTPDEMAALFADRPDLLANTLKVAELCEKDIMPGRTELPRLYENEGEVLRQEVYSSALRHHGHIGKRLKARLDLEIERTVRNDFAGHFLIAWDMCRWAKEQGIVFSGRGSVVDSAMAYYLGFSRINAFTHNLHYDRFLPEDGSKRPDIDIDFEARRRDDVRNYLVGKYGDKHVATVSAIGAYCTRGIIREVGKVMGIPAESLGHLAKRLHGSVTPEKLEQAINARPELRDSGIPRERFLWVFKLAEHLMDLPRNMRSHSSGVVISREPVCDIVPVMYSGAEDVKIIQWDKRSAKRCFDKFDVLCLRGNDVLAGTQRRVRAMDEEEFSVEKLPLDDPNTYRAMREGELIGIPQSASPAMRQAHARLRTMDLKDASIVQAGIRPGVGGAVKINELIARRRGKPYSFLNPEMERIMGPTYGIVVFQEQVDMLLQTFGGYSSDEAENVRDAIHKKRKEDYVKGIREEVIGRVLKNGYSMEVANEVYDLVSVFQGYGFAEGHALAFAEVSIRSIWCQQNYPAEYFASLLDAQPAGYYGPCTIANEARIRDVQMRHPDVNHSELNFKVESVQAVNPPMIVPSGAIRISLKQILGLSKGTAERIVSCRVEGPYTSMFDFARRVRPQRDELERLVLCGALDGLHLNRRAMLWSVCSAIEYAATANSTLDALPMSVPEPEMPTGVVDFNDGEKAIHERSILEMDVSQHLLAFERDRIQAKGGFTAYEASKLAPGTKAFAVGNPLRLRFPPTSSGKRVMFFDLEDETGLLNVTCFNEVYLKDGHTVVCSQYVTLVGEAQDRDGYIAFLAHRVYPYKPQLTHKSPIPQAVIPTGDFLMK